MQPEIDTRQGHCPRNRAGYLGEEGVEMIDFDGAKRDVEICLVTANLHLPCDTETLGRIYRFIEEVARLTLELASTQKAKQENDERFMIERDEARAEVIRLTAEVELRDRAMERLAGVGIRSCSMCPVPHESNVMLRKCFHDRSGGACIQARIAAAMEAAKEGK